MTNAIPAPSGLGTRGGQFWRETVAEFELTASETALLTECCRTLDLVDELEAQVKRDGLTVAGASGQDRLHPAVTELRGQRLALHRLLAALGLEDAEDGHKVPTATSLRAQHAARARWAGHVRDTGA
ncbi:hypothetical protein GCM10009809_08270 [Isoptericola hypogeus]|uniref:Terminase n=1 Tax=Isoptericola hypogeus TaxID=300179 RepID=A0ABN2IYU7_9MICO